MGKEGLYCHARRKPVACLPRVALLLAGVQTGLILLNQWCPVCLRGTCVVVALHHITSHTYIHTLHYIHYIHSITYITLHT